MEPGYVEGEICNRNGCTGVIDIHPSENCSCHINPPCGACTSPRNFCPVCDWQESDEYRVYGFNDHIVTENKETGVWKSFEWRPLDPTKVDWHSKTHTHFTMIKEGVYPPGMSKDEVREIVKGTFGGRFDYFGDGKFKYVAYTD